MLLFHYFTTLSLHLIVLRQLTVVHRSKFTPLVLTLKLCAIKKMFLKEDIFLKQMS